MFSLFQKPHPRQPTAALAKALAGDGLPPGLQASSLLVVLQAGSYADRNVNYFRVFDPVRAQARGLEVNGFADLDTHLDLVVASGHIEKNGGVVLTRRAPDQLAATLVRNEADRSVHGDDEQFVFPNRTA